MSQSLTQVSDKPLPDRAPSAGDLYAGRKLAEGYPGLDRLALKKFTATLDAQADDTPRLERLLARLNRLIDLDSARNIVVLGCGPRPQTVKHLLERRFNVIGQQAGVFGLMDMMWGKALSRFTGFAVVVAPHTSPSIIMQLMSYALPTLEAPKTEGESGRRKSTQYTRYGTRGHAVFQALGI